MSVIGVVFLGAVGIDELVVEEEAGGGAIGDEDEAGGVVDVVVVFVDVVAVVVVSIAVVDGLGCKSTEGYVGAAEDMITVLKTNQKGKSEEQKWER
mmetsp:Transcript_32426/g.68192  ORF Transcript_32426/g.68192 Transcript_32426/m.68192 type:complete len:96 (+) Transcript_32426:1400-1687(+)